MFLPLQQSWLWDELHPQPVGDQAPSRQPSPAAPSTGSRWSSTGIPPQHPEPAPPASAAAQTTQQRSQRVQTAAAAPPQSHDAQWRPKPKPTHSSRSRHAHTSRSRHAHTSRDGGRTPRRRPAHGAEQGWPCRDTCPRPDWTWDWTTRWQPWRLQPQPIKRAATPRGWNQLRAKRTNWLSWTATSPITGTGERVRVEPSASLWGSCRGTNGLPTRFCLGWS